MADRKPTDGHYDNLGGVNVKASRYSTGPTQFLGLRNVDFDRPNALRKRPGSTQMVTPATSGPVIGLFEYSKLTGQSFIIAGTDTALFYLASNAYTLLDTGWNNGQPQDMLTFVNKLWVADGGRYKTWDGTTTPKAVGLPCPPTGASSTAVNYLGIHFNGGAPGGTIFLVGGATMAIQRNSASMIVRGVYVAYSFVRSDGYFGPVDFLSSARNVISSEASVNPVQTNNNGEELFTYNVPASDTVYGFTASAAAVAGATAIAMWVAVDSAGTGTTRRDPAYFTTSAFASGASGAFPVATGNLGQIVTSSIANSVEMSYTLIPNADVSRFYLYTLLPINTTSTTFTPIFNSYTGSAGGTYAFSGMPFCWFDTNTPKYIDVNQNVMFMSGFSNAPSTVWFSDIGEPESIDPTYNFEVRTNDGDRIVGVRAYNGTTVVLKETSFHKILGSTPDDFQLVELSLEFGALSNKAIVEYNEKLLWLDRKGIVEYDGASWNIISDPVDEIFRTMNLSAALEKAVAVHHHYRNQVWFGIPVNGSTVNNLTVVYDYLVKAWTFFDGFDAASFAFNKGPLSKQTVWRGDYSGLIYSHQESLFGDNGRGISCVITSRFDQYQGENSTNVWRRFFLDVSSVSGPTGVITGKVFTDYNLTTVQATFVMYQSVFQSKAEMGVVGKAVAFELSHNSASLPFLMNGYSWQKRNLRNV